jgi:hypothetical protein
VIDGKPDTIKPVRSLVEAGSEPDDSVVLPTDLLEQLGPETDSSIGDTMHAGDDEVEDPIAALDRLTELELPDPDAK